MAAQLDGARKDMNEKLANSSLSASKEPLVVRAEEHAKSLQDLAKQLEEYVAIPVNENFLYITSIVATFCLQLHLL